MINKLIIDGAQIQLNEDDKIPYLYTFATSKTHTVKFALDDTNEICAEAFKNCTNLTKINFPEQIKMIKRRAFENCSRLDNVIIPANIEYIGANVFDGCTSLKEMKFEATTPPQNYSEIPSQTTCYIPTGTKYSKVETLDPDNEIYYRKSWFNQYTEVVGANLKLDGSEEYYKDNWVSIAPNYQTVEEKDRKPVDTIEFEFNSFRVTDPSQEYITFTYTLVPEDTTNPAIYFKTSNEYLFELVEGTNTPNQVTFKIFNRNGVGDIFAYAESGTWSKTNVTVMGRTSTGGGETPTVPPTPEEPETPTNVLVASLPNAETTITSVAKEDGSGEYKFYATTPEGIKVECIISNWDEWAHYYETCDPTNPELVHFLNTKVCTELGVPTDEKLLSKTEKKGTVVTEPRICILDNAEFRIIVPADVDVDYAIVHASGHNGAKSAIEYVYGHQDGVYINPKDMVPGSEGTTDITIAFRDKREEYVLFNGSLENCKKFWASFDFYKYAEGAEKPVLPPVETVNPPIADEMYNEFVSENIDGDGKMVPVATNVTALSGICLAEDKSCLYGVSDTYGLYKINFDGTSELLYNTYNEETKDTELDLEGICIDENGDLYACIENGTTNYEGKHLVKFAKADGYKSYTVVNEVDNDKLDAIMKEFNNGFEGIAYDSNEKVFYLGNQFKPISVTKYSLTEGVKDSFELEFDNTIGGTTEVGDLQFDPTNNTLWVIDSRSSNMYNYSLDGKNLNSYKTNIGSTPNTESFVIDFENKKLYVACDNATGDLYTFKFEPKEVVLPEPEEPETPDVPVVPPTPEAPEDGSSDSSSDVQSLNNNDINDGEGETGEDYFNIPIDNEPGIPN